MCEDYKTFRVKKVPISISTLQGGK